MGTSSKPSGSQVVTQSNAPWAGQQPYLETGFEKAKDLVLDQPGTYYPGSTVIDMDPRTKEGLTAVEDRARAGSPAVEQAAANIATTAGGGFLGSNPYLQDAIDRASAGVTRNYQKAVLPGIDSRFSASGRYGSGLQQSALGDAQETLAGQLGDIATGMSYADYGKERDRMLTASGMAPGIAEAEYMDAGKLMGVGQAYEQQEGAKLQEDIERYYQEENAAKQALANYMSLVGGGQYGSETTRTTPIYSNPLGTGLGTLGALAGIGNLFGFWGN
jgi:hypothetical protein